MSEEKPATLELEGKILALILWDVEAGDDEAGDDEASCHTGFIRRGEDGYELYREDGSVLLHLRPEWLERIKPVPDDLKSIVSGADLMLSLTVGPIPDGTDTSELVGIGLKLPTSEGQE